ncbi:MAG: hypothetical protein IAF38_14750, partial [Bacteroidia bacterium]|nr:hypothetical protein [Bacteroidia bacterium]
MKSCKSIPQRAVHLKGDERTRLFFLSLILLLIFISQISLAQTYVRTHKNIGFFGSVYMPDFAMRTGATKGATQGAGFSVGLTKQMGRIFYPEVFFVQHQNKVNVPLGRAGWTQQ